MNVRYDVRAFDQKAFTVGNMDSGMRFNDQREAFNLAKKIAAQYGEATMSKLTWDDKGRITTETCVVHANGKFRYI